MRDPHFEVGAGAQHRPRLRIRTAIRTVATAATAARASMSRAPAWVTHYPWNFHQQSSRKCPPEYVVRGVIHSTSPCPCGRRRDLTWTGVELSAPLQCYIATQPPQRGTGPCMKLETATSAPSDPHCTRRHRRRALVWACSTAQRVLNPGAEVWSLGPHEPLPRLGGAETRAALQHCHCYCHINTRDVSRPNCESVGAHSSGTPLVKEASSSPSSGSDLLHGVAHTIWREDISHLRTQLDHS